MEIGLIYFICNCIDDDKYIGSTTDDLSQRLIKHKWEAKRCPHIKLYQKFNEVGFDNKQLEFWGNRQHACDQRRDIFSFVVRSRLYERSAGGPIVIGTNITSKHLSLTVAGYWK